MRGHHLSTSVGTKSSRRLVFLELHASSVTVNTGLHKNIEIFCPILVAANTKIHSILGLILHLLLHFQYH